MCNLCTLLPFPFSRSCQITLYTFNIMDTEETCAFDKLLKINVPHIHQNIFLHLDFESFKTCRRVSIEWKKLLMTESFQRKAESLFLEEVTRLEEKLLRSKIEAAQKSQRLKYLLEAIILYVIWFSSFCILMNGISNQEHHRKCRIDPTCSAKLAVQTFIVFGVCNLILILLISMLARSILTEYQDKWAQEWTGILKTEQYKSNIASVLRNDVLGKIGSSEPNVFHKDILKREEEFRCRELREEMRELHLIHILFIWVIWCMISFMAFMAIRTLHRKQLFP